MGLKEKLKNAFTPKSIYRLKTQIEAQDEVIKSLNEFRTPRNTDEEHIYQRDNWNTFQWLIIYGNYFANRFKFETYDHAKNIFISKAIRQAFMFGSIGVWNNCGLPTLCYIYENDIKKDYYTICIDIVWDSFEIDNPNQSKVLKVKKEDVIIYSFDNFGLPAIYMLKPLIEWEKRQDNNFSNEQIALPTRILQQSETSIARYLANKFCANKSPIIFQGRNHNNKFEPLALDTNIMEIIEHDKYERARFYQLLGIRTNLERKNERNVSDEVEQNDVYFQILENERHLHLKQFLTQFSNQFKLEVWLENPSGEMEILNGY